MPTHKQITVNSAVTEKGMGTAATNELRNIFTNSLFDKTLVKTLNYHIKMFFETYFH